MPKRILVPVDDRPASLEAIEAAAQLEPAEIVLLHVVEPIDVVIPQHLYPLGPLKGPLSNHQRASGKARLDQLTPCVRARKIRCKSVLRAGVPWQEIVRAAGEVRSDMIVMATAARHGLPHVLIGSVTEKVLRAAPCPVLTLRAGAGSRRKSQ